VGAFVKKKVYVPQNPELNYMGLIIGPRGSTQKDLEQRTGAKILFRGRGAHKDGHVPSGHPDDDDNLHIAVEGPHDAVQRAVSELEDILHNPERASKLKQEQLRSLAEMNNANSIYGPSGVSSSESRELNGETVLELKVPNHLVGYVIGKGGENIQKMQAQTGGHVQIAKESEMKPGETMRTVTLRGSPGGVQELKRRVEELVAERTRPTGISQTARTTQQQNKELDNAFVLKVAVPNDKVGLVIGKGGVTIKAIQDRTFCNVLIPPNADEDNPAVRTLSIGGESREAVEACQMEIFMTLQQHQQQQVQQQLQAAATAPSVMYMAVPDEKVGIIIGKGGVTIKELQQKYGCRIQIPTAADPGSYPPVRTIR
jgi:far upstream element-binding protein